MFLILIDYQLSAEDPVAPEGPWGGRSRAGSSK